MSESKKTVKGNVADEAAEEEKDESEAKETGAEKAKKISNPLTMIGIFASIAEGAGAAVLPFIDKSLHSTYIWFIIGFPMLLVLLFFLTLNFNHVKLYAPDDFDNDMAFLAINMASQQLAKDVENQISDIEKSLDMVREQVKKDIEVESSIRSQNLAHIQGLLGTPEPGIAPEFFNVQEFMDTRNLADSKNKIDDISSKLEETRKAASRYTDITRDIQRLRNNPKKLIKYLAESTVTNISA